MPLREPFVIANAALTHTQAALVRVSAEAEGGRRVEGLGEAAALPPVTAENQDDLLATLGATDFAGVELSRLEEIEALLPASGAASRAGLECALIDALAKAERVPLCALLGSFFSPSGAGGTATLHTDITLPIGAPDHLAALARAYAAQGFDRLKVKVGRDLGNDTQTLALVHQAAPSAWLRLDANEGYTAAQALLLLDAADALGIVVECFEQPCRTLEDMASVARAGRVPVIADESVKTPADVDVIADRGAAHAVNLKLAKLGGLLPALATARRARERGLRLMAGAMVETRLGMCAMAHLVTAIGGVDWLDLDTDLLLASDPFSGGYTRSGSVLTLSGKPGLDVRTGSGPARDEANTIPA